MRNTYMNCINLISGNHYWYSNNVSNVQNCFYGKNNSRRYNIYIPANSVTLNTCLIKNTKSLVGATITWTKASSYYYNTTRNIYIYPVANVAAAYEANENNNLITFTIDGAEY
jgi:hypothetical protein